MLKMCNNVISLENTNDIFQSISRILEKHLCIYFVSNCLTCLSESFITYKCQKEYRVNYMILQKYIINVISLKLMLEMKGEKST